MASYASYGASRKRDDAQTAIAVPAPSAHAGIGKALRAAYDLSQLPAELANLLAKLR